MSLNLELLGREWDVGTATWTSTDALLYALGVGAGRTNPLRELAYTTENSVGVDQVVLPTFLATRGGDGEHPSLGDFDLDQVLHGAQTLTVNAPIPVDGTVSVRRRVSNILDKGRDAVIELTSDLIEPASRVVIATTVTTMFVRGEGGFGGERGAPQVPVVYDREPDWSLSSTTDANQALLYRLSGDRNPLHSDPAFAAKAGFDRPILHGLCTYGIAGRLLLNTVLDGQVERFGAIEARFVSPVTPGETLKVSAWQLDDHVAFIVRVADRVVLDRGLLRERTHD